MPSSSTPSARRTLTLRGGLRLTASMVGLALVLYAGAAYAHRPLNGANGTSAAVALEEAAAYERTALRGRPVQLDGSLQVLHEDYADGTGRYRFFLESQSERIELHFNGDTTRHMTGQRVRVTGRLDGNELAIDSATTDVQLLSTTKALSLYNTFGPQKTAVILVNFSNNPTQPYTTTFARNVVFGTTSNFDLENSYGQTSLTGDVFGWYTIALTSTVCDYSTLATQARTAATNAGVNFTGYTRFVYAFPGNACGWWGLGTVGGNPSSAWINGSLQLAVVGHEMGHNFGLYHSHAYECGNVPLSTTCTSVEYGDQLDIMGNGSNHFNAFQKERLGWLNYGSSPPITTVASTGSYTIEAMETPGTAPKALKIPIGTTGKYYYVELRRGMGFDANLANNTNVMGGIVLHQASPSNGDSSQLLDMTATSSWSDPALMVGLSFVDPNANISITPTAVTSTNAIVSVTMGTSVCTRINPTVTMSPSQSSGAPGTTLAFVATITNNDTSTCSSSTFDVTDVVPTGWTGTLSAAALTLAPGATSTTTLQVTSASSTTTGTYPVNATAKNRSATAYAASGNASYVVSSTCTRANPAVTLSPSTSSSVAPGTVVTYTVTVTNKDSSACASSTFDLTNSVPAGWTGTLTASSLSLSAGASGTTSLKVTSATTATTGNYTVSATAKNHGATSYQATGSAIYAVSAGTTTTAGTFSDTFNRADSTSIGSAWTVAQGSFVISNYALKNAIGSGTSIATVGGLSGATQTVAADFTSVDNNLGPRFGVVLRYKDSKNYYLVYRQTGGSSQLRISKIVNGVETVLRAASIANPTKLVPFRITGRISGNTISLDYNTTLDVVKVTESVSTFASGNPGIMVSPGGSSTAQQQADNFTATVQ